MKRQRRMRRGNRSRLSRCVCEALDRRLLLSAVSASNVDLTTAQGTPLAISPGTVLSATNGASQVLSYGSPADGTLSGSAPGTVTYTPNAGFTGTDSFPYTVEGPSVVATLSVPFGNNGYPAAFELDSYSLGYTVSNSGVISYQTLSFTADLGSFAPAIDGAATLGTLYGSGTLLTVYQAGSPIIQYGFTAFTFASDEETSSTGLGATETVTAKYTQLTTSYTLPASTIPTAADQVASFTDPQTSTAESFQSASASFSLTGSSNGSSFSALSLIDTAITSGATDLARLGLLKDSVPLVTFTDYNTAGGAVQQYYIQNAAVVSYSSSYRLGQMPADQFQLDFTTLTSDNDASSSIGRFNQTTQSGSTAAGIPQPPSGSIHASVPTATATTPASATPAGPVGAAPAIGALAINTFSFGLTGASSVNGATQKSAVNEITFTAPVGADGPAWLVDAGEGFMYSSITLAQTAPGAVATLTYLSIVLGNVAVSGYSVSSVNGVDTETVTLLTTSVDEKFTPILASGYAGQTVDRSFNFSTDQPGTASGYTQGVLRPAAYSAILTFPALDEPNAQQLPVDSYSFAFASVTTSTGGKVVVSDIDLTLAASAQSPILFADATLGMAISGTVTLAIYGASATTPVVTYSLNETGVGSDEIDGNNSRNTVETLNLSVGGFSAAYGSTPQSVAPAADSQTLTYYNSSGGSVTIPFAQSTGGLDIPPSAGTLPVPALEPVTGITPTSAAVGQFVSGISTGTQLAVVVLTDYGPDGSAVVSYTLQNVHVTSLAESLSAGQSSPADALTLAATAVTVDYLPSSVTTFNATNDTFTPPGTTPPAPTGSPTPGGSTPGVSNSSLIELDVTGGGQGGEVAIGRIAPLSFDYVQPGANGGKTDKPTLTLVVPLGSDAPDFFHDTAGEYLQNTATLIQRNSAGNTLVQWVLSGMQFVSFSLNDGSDGAADATETIVLTGIQATISSTRPAITRGFNFSSNTPTTASGYPGTMTFGDPDTATALVVVTVTAAPPLVLTGLNEYLKLDADGVTLDVYPATTPTGTPATYTLAELSSIVIDPATAGTGVTTVDFSAGDPIPTGGLAVNGSAGGVNLSLVVDGTTGNDAVTVNASNLSFGSVPIAYTAVTAITFNGGGGADSLTQTAQPGGAALLTFAGTNAASRLNVAAGTYTFATTTALAVDPFAVITIAQGATVNVAAPITHADRTLLMTAALSNNGTLNLGGNDLDVSGATLADVSSLLHSGYAKGNWNGTGITSSAAASDTTHLSALGVIQNNQSGSPLFTGARTFDGITPGAGDVLVKYTSVGDANLDGKVDGSDYTLIDAGYLADKAQPGSATGWYNGDFNYDGVIDGSDYTLIDNAFNNQRTAFPSATVAAAVAEPKPMPVLAVPPVTETTRSARRSLSPNFVPPPPAAAAATPAAFSTTAIAADLLELLKRGRVA